MVVVIAVLPLNGTSIDTLNNNYTFDIRWDYLIHGLLFIPLYPLLFLASNDIVRKTMIIALSIVIITEGIQYFLPYRAFNLNDMLGNGIGMLVGVSSVFIINKIKNK